MRRLFIILVSALIFRLILSPYGSHPIDVPDWIGWSSRLLEVPFSKFYDAWCDYLPGYLYILWFLGLVKNLLIAAGITIKADVIYKLPAILADIATGYLIFSITKRYFNQTRAAIFTSLYLFNPAIFVNSTLWGQVDSVTAFFSLLTIFLIFEKKIVFSSAAFVFSFLSKPIGLLVGPLVAFVLLKKEGWKNTLIFGAISIFLTILLFIPFSNRSNLFQFFQERLSVTFGQYPYTSLTSFNFWYLVADFWKSDQLTWMGITYQIWGALIFGFFTLLGLFLLFKNWGDDNRKNFESTIICATLIYAAGFLFLTRVHERQLHSAITFFAVSAIFRPKLLIYYLIFSITYLLDLRFAFIWVAENFRYIFSKDIITLLSLINLFVFAIFIGTILPKKIWPRKFLPI